MFENVVFTDRYGGHLPSALRVCGDCEGMGVALYDDIADPCPFCAGSGRVSWLQTIARVPRWIVKGLAFIRQMNRAEMHPPEWSTVKRWRVLLWCAFGADLQRLF